MSIKNNSIVKRVLPALKSISNKTSLVDRVLMAAFAFSKVASAIVVALCLCVIAFTSLCLLFGGGKSLDVPEFSEREAASEDSNTTDKYGMNAPSKRSTKRAVEKKFGEDIEEIIKDYKLQSNYYDYILGVLVDTDEDHRRKCLSGLDDYLDDAQKDLKENNKSERLEPYVPEYFQFFAESALAVKASEIEAAAAKVSNKITLAVTTVILLAFIIIPLLIKIEQNTRPSTSDEPKK